MRHTPPQPAKDPLEMVGRLGGYFRDHPPRNRAQMRQATKDLTRKSGPGWTKRGTRP